ncbi:AAA family ATPase [Streptomyces sp. CA-288835]|uniref:AAA family ATPase n=1 Tax=Streptomyces sp. CA-288835 TaxID=3240069 RepID=UPI003D92F295
MTGDTTNALAARLAAAQRRSFVGREAEIDRFAAMLRREPGSPAVLYVHGMGGVGKTTLMRRLATEAREAGHAVSQVEGRHVEPSPQGFERAASGVLGETHSVLLIDSFEHCQGLEGWLREQYLPTVPETTVVVIAGRRPPTAQWTYDIAWTDALAVMELRPLDEEHAHVLLERHEVPVALREKIFAFAGGHPLALRIAASLVTAHSDAPADWGPDSHIIGELLASLVGTLPTEQHRTALETAAHVMTLNRSLLGAVMGQDSAGPMFDWLCELPFTELGPRGLSVHDLAAEVLDRDLRWRDPEGYELMHHKVGRFLLNRTRTAPEVEAVQAMRALTYLKRHGPMRAFVESIEREGDVWEEPLRPEDHEIVLKIMAHVEDEDSVAIVRFWLERQPEAFWLYRDTRTGHPMGFMAWLRLTRREPDHQADPVVAAVWDHIESHGPLRTGQHVGIARFCVGESSYGGVSPVEHLMELHVTKDLLRAAGMGWSFIVTTHVELWRELMHLNGHRQIVSAAVDSGSVWTAFGCDWRANPLESWFDRTWSLLPQAEPVHAAKRSEPPLDLGTFTAAVRTALRDLHTAALRENPLLATRLMTERADRTGTDDKQLRQVLLETIENLRHDPRHTKAYRALKATYTPRHRTQEAAAAHLGIPFSSYRRHLAQGIDRVVELLWQQEVTLPAPEGALLPVTAERSALDILGDPQAP